MTNRPMPRPVQASAASVLMLGMLLAGCLAGCSGDSSGDDPAGSSPATGAATPSGTVTVSRPPAASAKPSAAVSNAPAVKLGRPADLQQDVTARVVGVSKVNLTAEGPGEIAGAGAAVKLRISNESPRPIDLGQLVVNAYYGPEKTPAVPNTTNGGGGRELAGSLKAGASRTGTYYFAVPSKSFSSLDVEVSSGDSPYVITFVHD